MNTRKTINFIARIAIFGSLAIILYMVPGLQFPIIPGLSFLQLHFDEIPCLFASFAFGPFTASFLIILKGLFKLIQDIGSTGGVGVLADIIYGLALVIPTGLLYKKYHTFNGTLLSLAAGILSSLIFSCFIGYYLIYPLYGVVLFGTTNYYDSLNVLYLNLFKAADPSISGPFDLKILYEFLLPFNLIKLGIISVVTIVIYKPLAYLIKKYRK